MDGEEFRPMRLIHRVIIVLATATAVLLLGNALVMHLFVDTHFQTIENGLALSNAERAVDAVSNDLDHLKASALDWASWDSSYSFMQGEDVQDFIDQNLVL